MNYDEGYQYGLGAFETINIVNQRALFLKEHIERLNKTLEFLNIAKAVTQEDVHNFLKKNNSGCYALKIIASEKNVIFKLRINPYVERNYEKDGFVMNYSKIRRNETSPLVYHKTLNYGECILEKRRALCMNMDDMLFLNGEGFLAEGTTCNIFFVKNGELYTPDISCGILPGIIRNHICQEYKVIESFILPGEVPNFEECFVTNSLMGIMPVNKLGEKEFCNEGITNTIKQKYFHDINNGRFS
jgi:4-amino-4-deoxychorismate lyase